MNKKSKQKLEILNILNKCAAHAGYDPESGKIGIKVVLYIGSYIMIVTNLIYFIRYKCNNVYDIVIAIKGAIFLTVFVAFSVIYILFWSDLLSVLSVFEEGHFDTNFEMSAERRNVMECCDKTLIDHAKFWINLIKLYLILMTLVPLTKLFFIFLTTNYRDINIETLPLMYPVYYPEKFNDMLLYYVIAFLLQCTFNILATVNVYLANVSTTAAMIFLKFEIKLLSLSMTEIDYIIDCLNKRMFKRHRYEIDFTRHNQWKDEGLHKFIVYFVHHHQSIYKKFNSINNGMKWISTNLKVVASIYLCMTIYTVIQESDKVIQLQELIFCVIWIYDTFLFDICGERLTQQDETLREQIFQCAWYNKPKWFKKSLLIIITRTYKPIQIKPFGFFALNFKNSTKTANAVYSYYNLLRKLK